MKIHHKKELEHFMMQEWFNLVNALDDYVACKKG